MFLATVTCSDPGCAVEAEVVVDDLELLEIELCAACDCLVAVLDISDYEPAHIPRNDSRRALAFL